MRKLLALTAASLPLTAAISAAPALAAAFDGPITAAGAAPAVVVAPGTATLRFTVTGREVDASTDLSIAPSPVYDARANGNLFPTSTLSLRVIGVTVDGPAKFVEVAGEGPAVVKPKLACQRGTFPELGYTQDFAIRHGNLVVPANSTSTLNVSVQVPRGFAADTPHTLQPGVSLGFGVLSAPGLATPAVALMAGQSVARGGTALDEVTLKVKKKGKGRALVSGRVFPANAGDKVQIVGRTGSPTKPGFESLTSALKPLGGSLRSFGSVKTTAKGTFSTTVKVPKGARLVARTAGSTAGASCPVVARP